MNLRKLTTLFTLIMVTGVLLAQNTTIYEFLGKVSIHDKKAKDVLIKAFDGDSCFSNYKTRSNGKFAFYGEGKKYFIIQFEKPGYVTKQLIVSTNNSKYANDEIKKYKFDINLHKTKKGHNDDEYISKIDVIELDNSGNGFTYKSNRNKKDYFISNQMASRL